jgi:hypothetical protein
MGDAMAEHTPTPWDCDGRTVYALCEDKSNNRFCAHVQGGWAIAPTKGRTTDQELEANAAFIVRAANCHAELVEVLEALCEKCAATLPVEASVGYAAIRKARGDTP